jgi:3-oxoacyl-(acyl-carrier-protein) synthase
MTTLPTTAVFISECECTTPLGSAAVTREALCEGKIALELTPLNGISDQPVLPLALFSPLGTETPPRWLEPCRKIVSELTPRPWGDPRHPVFISSSNFGIEQLLSHYQQPNPKLKAVATPAMASAAIANACGFGANYCVVSNACVSAQLALAEAETMIRSNHADEALVLSIDCLSSFVAGGFAALKILNGDLPRPYQVEENGSIGLGEGVAVAVVSRKESDIRLVSTVCHQESYHMTANDPSGVGFDAIAQSVQSLSGKRRLWLKGHGTGTLEAGRLEAEAFARAFPNSPLVSWKGSLGHTLGSCGLIEMAVAIAALRHGEAPGTCGTTGPYCAPTVTAETISTDSFDGVALFSSAFGGAHAATLIHNA